jgi:hypothetical protein
MVEGLTPAWKLANRRRSGKRRAQMQPSFVKMIQLWTLYPDAKTYVEALGRFREAMEREPYAST